MPAAWSHITTPTGAKAEREGWREKKEARKESGLAEGGKLISSLTQPCMIQHVRLSASFCPLASTWCMPRCESMQGDRLSEPCMFPRGLSKMYGLCGNWVSLILNDAIVAESQHLSEIALSTCPLHAPLLHPACTFQSVHALAHHRNMSSTIEWAVPSYLASLRSIIDIMEHCI